MKYYLPLCLTAILVLSLMSVSPASAAQGTGTLYVYYNETYTSIVNQNEHGHYEVLPGDTVYIQIVGITEFSPGDPGDLIDVKICWDDYTKTIEDVEVITLTSGAGIGQPGVGDATAPIEWTVGDFDGFDDLLPIPFSETMTVHYKSAIPPPGPDYITTIYDANGRIVVAHLHLVPENPIGTLGSMLALLAALGVFMAKGKRISLPIH